MAIEPNDPNWDRLTRQAKLAKNEPQVWLAMTDIYGDLGSKLQFATAFENALKSLWAVGVRSTLEGYLSDGSEGATS